MFHFSMSFKGICISNEKAFDDGLMGVLCPKMWVFCMKFYEKSFFKHFFMKFEEIMIFKKVFFIKTRKINKFTSKILKF